jgi:Sap, sulfolipid-1-addressing protein
MQQQAIGELLPLAVAVSISPLPIIAMVVLLMSPRARTSTPAFMLGWIASIATVLAVVALLSERFGGSDDGAPAPTVSVVKLVLGGVMLTLAWREWRTRPKPGQQAELPHWLTAVENMGPLAAAGTGFGIYAANPKNLTVGVSAGVLFHSFSLPTGLALIVGAIYVLVASSTVVLPILAFLVAEEKVRPWLNELQGWLTLHNAAVMTMLLFVIGAVMVGKGIATL